MIEATLVYIFNSNRVLLAMKKRGHGQGFWNGPGGKVQEGESIENAARRETREETGITVNELLPSGVIEFIYTTKTIRGHIFTCTSWRGEPQETEEMLPQWFAKDALPWDTMWPSDRLWLPSLLAGNAVHLRMFFDEHMQYVRSEPLIGHVTDTPA